MEYTAHASSGVVVDLEAKTLTGAKREASEWISFGSDVTVCGDNKPIAMREFWQERNLFGWAPWTLAAQLFNRRETLEMRPKPQEGKRW
jgi:hypothetical protein